MNKRPGYKGLQNTHLSHPTYHLGLDFSVLMLAPLKPEYLEKKIVTFTSEIFYTRRLLHQKTLTPDYFYDRICLHCSLYIGKNWGCKRAIV